MRSVTVLVVAAFIGVSSAVSCGSSASESTATSEASKSTEAPATTAASQSPTVAEGAVELFTLRGPDALPSVVAWSPNGTNLATAIHGEASIWDASTGIKLNEQHIDHLRDVTAIEWSPDSIHTALIAESDSGIYEPLSGPGLLMPVPDFLAYSPDGTRVAVGGAWGWSAVIDATTGNEQLSLPSCPTWVNAAAWSPDGARIATTCGSTVTISDAATGEEQHTLSQDAQAAGSNQEATDVAWSPEGTRIAVITGEPGTRDTVAAVWAVAIGEETDAPEQTISGVWALAWSPDGTRIVTAGANPTAAIWDTTSGDQLLSLAGHEALVTDVAWSPDGTRVATASLDGTVKVWLVD